MARRQSPAPTVAPSQSISRDQLDAIGRRLATAISIVAVCAQNAEEDPHQAGALIGARRELESIASEVDTLGANGAPGRAQEAPDFGSVTGAVLEQYGALRLAYLALGEFHDVSIGHVIDKDEAENLGAIHSQVGRVVEALDELTGDLMSTTPAPSSREAP